MPKRPRKHIEPELEILLKAEQEKTIKFWLDELNKTKDFAQKRNVIVKLIRWAKENDEVDVVREVIRRAGIAYEVETMRLRKMINPAKRVKLHSARELYCPICKRWHRSSSKLYENHYSYLIERRENPVGKLYEEFHGNSPKGTRKVFYEEPEGKLIKIGRLSEIRYVAEEPSQHSDTEFLHRAGDLGYKTIKSNAILCTNEEGTQLYIVKEKKGKYPLFSSKGILG